MIRIPIWYGFPVNAKAIQYCAVVGPGGLPPPPYFWTKLRLEGPKKKFFRLPSPLLSQALDDCPAPLSEGLDLPLQCAHSLMPE